MNLHKAIRLSVIFSLSIFKFLNIFPGFNLSSESSTIRVGNGGSSASFYLSKNVSGFNGTFRRGSNGTISNGTSKTIAFANGILDDNGVRSRTTSTYEPGGTYELTLGANQTLVGRPGQVTQNVKISGAGAKIEGQPTFDSALVFDENATAYFGLQSRLNQNIQFYSSGLTNTVFLNDDLKLADDVTIVNDGTIDVNGKSFWFGGKTLTLANTIHWANAGDINLSGRINFGGTWYVNDETNINGHGNIIDCSTGGVFDIAASTTLYLTDVTLKSIQDSTFIFRGVGSTIRLSKATLHFHENVTHDQGMIYVDGPSTVFIPDVDWTFNGDSKLTVSGSTLWTDELDRSGVDSIFGNLTMVYNGTIKENYATGDLDDVISQVANNSYAIVLHETRLDTAEANISSNDTDIAQNSEAIVVLDSRVDTHDTEIATNAANVTSGDTLLKFIHGPQDYTLSTNTTLTVDLWLSNDHVFTIGSDLTIDGDKHAITFAKGDNNVLSVGSNALTLENVVLKDFSPSAISLTTGSVTFGNGTRIEMTDNNLLTSSNYTMTFDGTVEMNCFGNEFDISGMEHGMVVQPGGKLCLSNARITGLGGASGSSYTNNLKCIGPDSTLTMSNCDLVMESNYSFTEGIIDIYQDVAIRGPEKPSGTSLVFAYQSPQAATIRSLGKLMFDRYITFSYDSDSATKDKIIMEDATSILHLNGCTLYSTQTGLELTGGRLVVEDKVTVQNEATIQSEAMVLKDPLDIDVLSGGVLDLTAGLLEYQ